VAGHERVVEWNVVAMMEEDAKAAERLWMELAIERSHSDAECTADKVEQEAAWCQEAMGHGLDATAMNIRICAQSKRWWNTDISETRKVVGTEEQSRPNMVKATRAKAELAKSSTQSKRKMWSEYLQILRGAEVWRAARYRNPRASTTMYALTDREGKQANTSVEKEDMLRLESFPPMTTTSTMNYLLQETHTHASQSKRLNKPIFSIRITGTGARQAVSHRHTTALQVGRKRYREADKVGRSHMNAPSSMKAG